MRHLHSSFYSHGSLLVIFKVLDGGESVLDSVKKEASTSKTWTRLALEVPVGEPRASKALIMFLGDAVNITGVSLTMSIDWARSNNNKLNHE